MKKQSNNLFTKFSNDALANLTREITETLATDFKFAIKNTFTAAELWNIQRQKKSVVLRRSPF